MAKLKGRQLGFVLLLCSGWAVARVVITSGPTHDIIPETASAPTRHLRAAMLEPQPQHSAPGIATNGLAAAFFAPVISRKNHPEDRLTTRRDYVAVADNREPFANVAPRQTPALPVRAAFAQSSLVAPPAAGNTKPNAIAQIYAYSFWRWGGQGSGLAAAGQYGGSQTGLIATFPLRRIFGDGDNLALLFRAATAPDFPADREVAAGLRWRPVSTLPVSITAERRFRPVGQDRFSVYLAGCTDDIKLPAQFNLDTYAQAGIVSGRGAGPFFDASARVNRAVYRTKALSTEIGGGLWAGGQRGAARLDIGPSIGADLAVGHARFRISGDWRFRIAGDARPGNGPALTLSTSF